MITDQQRATYRQALEAWKSAAKDADKVRAHLYGIPSSNDKVYLLTNQDLYYLQNEAQYYERLANLARQL
jgi:hypothetical protein